MTASWIRHLSPAKVDKLVLLAPVLDYCRDYLVLEDLGREVGVNDLARTQLDATDSLLTSGRHFSRSLINEFPYFSARPLPSLPLLLIHGNADTGVPYAHSQQLAKEYPETKFFTIPNAEHGFAEPGDENLDWPQTLENHRQVYNIIEHFIVGS